jgi:hypothetical protein
LEHLLTFRFGQCVATHSIPLSSMEAQPVRLSTSMHPPFAGKKLSKPSGEVQKDGRKTAERRQKDGRQKDGRKTAERRQTERRQKDGRKTADGRRQTADGS